MHDSLFKSVMAKQAGRHRMWPDAENQTIIKDWLCHALFFEHETEDVENFFFFLCKGNFSYINRFIKSYCTAISVVAQTRPC
jgi:hypothetical protein